MQVKQTGGTLKLEGAAGVLRPDFVLVDLAHLEYLNCTLAHTYWHMLFTKMTRRLSSIVVASPSAMLSRALWTQNSLTDHNPIPHELVKRQLA